MTPRPRQTRWRQSRRSSTDRCEGNWPTVGATFGFGTSGITRVCHAIGQLESTIQRANPLGDKANPAVNTYTTKAVCDAAAMATQHEVDGDGATDAYGPARFLDATARPPTYDEAVEMLGLEDGKAVVVLGLELKAWQVTGPAWMARQEASVGGMILADDCGLGKTVTTLTLVDWAARHGHSTKPTLVLCPSGLVDTWVGEVRAHIGETIHPLVFHRSQAATSIPWEKEMTRDTFEDLQATLTALDEATAARTVVVSSYHTWAIRTTYLQSDLQDNEDDVITQLGQLQEDAHGDTDKEVESSDHGPKAGEGSRQRKRYGSRATGMFQRVVCDDEPRH